jgi:hypothetical protein
MTTRTTRDVWATMGIGVEPVAVPANVPPPDELAGNAGVEMPAGASGATHPTERASLERAPRPQRARSTATPTVKPVAGDRLDRPCRLQINITRHAEQLIRAGIDAKRSRGLRGHAASITVVVEEALESALHHLVSKAPR